MSLRDRLRGPFALDVLFPFALTRAALLWLAWWTKQYAPATDYPHAETVARGWAYVPLRSLDVWMRWDTGWFVGIAAHGYQPSAPGAEGSVAFFPLYPLAIRLLSPLLPDHPAAPAVAGVLLSNACAIAALATLRTLVHEAWGDEALARRTVLYVLLFPAGFFLSCAYSEAPFLLLTTGAFLCAQRRRWALAGVLAALAAVTRSTGILVAPALAWAYLAARGWRWREVRADAAALLLPLAAFGAHAWNAARLNGDPGAVFHVQAAWGRSLAWPWQTLARKGHRYVGHSDRFAIVGFTALTARLATLRRAEWTIYAALSLVPVLASGLPLSATRLLSVVFPAFVPLAMAGRRERAHLAIVVCLLVAQAALFTSWATFHWAG